MKAGFFDLGTGDTPSTIKKPVAKKQGCEACGLREHCDSPQMLPSGKGVMKILILGEAPGLSEDQEGVQFVGRSGQLLQDTLSALGIKMRRDCRITNAVNCHPEKNKTPTDAQVSNCHIHLSNTIRDFQPHVIIPLGAAAVQSVIGCKASGWISGIANTMYYGEQIPDQEYKAWICPTYHPAYLLYNEKDRVLKRIWKKNLQDAIKLAEKNITVPEISPELSCYPIHTLDDSIDILKEIIENKYTTITYDYETTGIKPHRSGHEIISVAVAFKDKAHAFLFYPDETFRNLWKQIMTDPGIKKIAHKLDFENIWTYKALGVYPEPYEWDTCLASHCICNKKSTKLKYQTYVNFGIMGYDEAVNQYITDILPGEDPKSGNRFNRIKEAPRESLLLYNAMDAYFTYKLYEKQKTQLTGFQLEGFRFFLEGAEALSQIQNEGFHIDTEWMTTQFDRLAKRMNTSEKKILDSDEVKQWKKSESKELNINSHPQLRKLLYNILGHKEPSGPKTDEDALNNIGSEFTKNILIYRKLKKIRDTYMAQYAREQVDGIIRPFFNLHLVSTYRSSCDSPNFQNVPKHDKQAKQILRSLFRPSPGNRLIEYDYKGIEVCIGTCHHKDPVMLDYILDPSTDMHRDTAMDLFFRTKEDFTKDERQIAKNGLVFPIFYGSSTEQVAPNIWKMIDSNTRKHLADNGITSFPKFKRHVEDIEDHLWEKRFKVYAKWKREIFWIYEKQGYIDLFTGFRCYGPMKFTEVTNYPIQGSAFHCLLWTLIQTHKRIKDISGQSAIIGQIHDAIVADVYPDDEAEVDRIINNWGTKKIIEHWPWIITPLKIEKERSEIDGSWDEMTECEMDA